MKTSDMTVAERQVLETLTKLLPVDGPYGCGVLVLTYRAPGSDELDRRFAKAVAMSSKAAALDCVMMPRFLRGLADEIEGAIKSGQPLQTVEEG